MDRYSWAVPYGVIWASTFGAALVVYTLLRWIRADPRGLVLAAGLATAVVAVEVITDRAEQRDE